MHALYYNSYLLYGTVEVSDGEFEAANEETFPELSLFTLRFAYSMAPLSSLR